MSEGPRYQAREGSEHSPRNDAHVVDTDRTDREGYMPTICECLDLDHARMIAFALNRSAMA